MATTTGDVRIVLTVNSAGAVKNVENFDHALAALGQTHKAGAGYFSEFTASFERQAMTYLSGQVAAEAVINTARKVWTEVKSIVDASSEAEAVEAQLEARLRSTKNAAGMYAQELVSLAAAKQRQSTYDDEMIIGAENILLTFTKIGRDVFPETLTAVMDMSKALGQDLQSSAMRIGKAMQNPAQGLLALRRSGVSFSESQQRVIKDLAETGHHSEAMQLILKELNKEFGGSAAAAVETYRGRMSQLSNVYMDLKERAGKLFIANGEVLRTLEGIAQIVEYLKIKVEEMGAAGNESWLSYLSPLHPVAQGVMLVRTAIQGTLNQHKRWNEYLDANAGKMGVWYGGLVKAVPALKDLAAPLEDVKNKAKSLNDQNAAAEAFAARLAKIKESLNIKDSDDFRKRIDDIKLALSSLPLTQDIREKLTAELNELTDKLAGPFWAKFNQMMRGEFGKAPVAIPIKVEFVGNAPAGSLSEVTETLEVAEIPAAHLTSIWKTLNIAMAQTKTVNIKERLKQIRTELELLGPRTLENAVRFDELTAEAEKLNDIKFSKFTRAVGKAVEAVSLIKDALSGVTSAITAGEETRVENWYKKRLDYINKTISSETKKERAIAALEAEYELKRTSAKRKAAVVEKASNLVSAAMNTAVAITNALKTTPVWLGIALAATVGTMGAIQQAFIAGAPLPLAKGGLFERRTVLASGFELAEAGHREIVSPEPLMRQIVRQESRTVNSTIALHVNFTVNALDSVGVEQMLRTTGVRIIQEALDGQHLKVVRA